MPRTGRAGSKRQPWSAPLGAAAAAALFALAACSSDPPETPQLMLAPVGFAEIAGWQADDPRAALLAFRRSCARWQNKVVSVPAGGDPRMGLAGDWHPVCEAAAAPGAMESPAAARAVFETWLQAYRVSDHDQAEGLFTGYYEPLLEGSRHFGGRYTVPLYLKPGNLVTVDLGRFNPDLSGYSIAGRVDGNSFVPYYSRAEIERGALDGQGQPLLWVDDEVDKFFLQIQGSGQVRLEDGGIIRVGYAAQNGHPYRAIGRDLVEMGALALEEVSLQRIRAWLRAHPQQAAEIMQRNRSYVFFQENPELGPEDGPIGAHGVPLTAGRSLAVDPRHIPLGVPLWLDTVAPLPEGEQPLRRLMIAQDTGGAIKGVVRGDVFWGAGERAEAVAGTMKSRGSYLILLPKAAIPTS